MPPARKSCEGCRKSKTRCDVEQHPNGVCSRCARLGAACVLSELVQSRRARPHAGGWAAGAPVPAVAMHSAVGQPVSPDARHREALSPAEALLAPVPPRCCTELAVELSGHNLHWVWPLHRDLLKEERESAVRLWWIRSAFTTARRHGNWDATTDALRMAKELSFSLDEALSLMAIAHADAQSPHPQEPLPWPEFICEWHTGAAPCVVRIEVDGVLRHFFNKHLTDAWAQQGVPAATLQALVAKGTGVAVGNPWDVDDLLLSLWDGPLDMRAFVQLWVQLWSQVSPDAAVRHVEGSAVRRMTLNVHGVRIGPCAVRMRVVSRKGGRERWEAIVHDLSDLDSAPAPEAQAGEAGADAPMGEGAGASPHGGAAGSSCGGGGIGGGPSAAHGAGYAGTGVPRWPDGSCGAGPSGLPAAGLCEAEAGEDCGLLLEQLLEMCDQPLLVEQAQSAEEVGP